MLRYHIVVHGDVQGVGFRYFTQKNAMFNDIYGWVRNRADGTVEIDAEGKELNIAKFLNAIKKGNSFSYVESADIELLKDLNNYRSFDVIDDDR